MTTGPVTIHALTLMSAGRLVWALIAALVLTTVGDMDVAVGAPNSRPPVETTFQATGEVPERNSRRPGDVHDMAEILTAEQEDSIQSDIDRASGLGVQMLVYTRMSDDSAAQAQEFADELKSRWEVESEEGAQDGLVFLITVNPADPETNSIVVGAGDEALPIRQLDADTLQEIVDTEMQPAVDEGEFISAIHYGTRGVLNYMEYSPPDTPPLSSSQSTMRMSANILGALLVQIAIAGYFVIPAIRERRFSLWPQPRSLAIYAVCLGLASILTGIVAIGGRNTLVTLGALGAFLLATAVIPLLVRFGDTRGQHPRVVPVGGRVRGRTGVIGSANG